MRAQIALETTNCSLFSAVSNYYESSFSYFWEWVWNRIETLRDLNVKSVRSSRNYFVHLNSIKLTTNPSWLNSSIVWAAILKPEDASSNPARCNEFFVVLCSVVLIWISIFHISVPNCPTFKNWTNSFKIYFVNSFRYNILIILNTSKFEHTILGRVLSKVDQ